MEPSTEKYAYPRELAAVGFFEDYFDNQRSAVSAFQAYMAALCRPRRRMNESSDMARDRRGSPVGTGSRPEQRPRVSPEHGLSATEWAVIEVRVQADNQVREVTNPDNIR
jgi:hypothetical protein